MNGSQKVTGFVLALAVVFNTAFRIGESAIDHSVPPAKPPVESGHGH
ncbi:hypothetical protein H7J93_00775 [Mycobacterium barrassiae]|nr:hypothetical protein [Mycobacterium barrassiae]MCV7298171.1 hypothetical protein [Mycobacterium barrassiae]